ncbi:MAG TPA: site-2 protease family protein, partial [Bacteroidia bacterium]|nr:site-2 protease family protein [Bacteroidia bacterium]
MAVPFFLVSWVVLLVLHELGHALMARWLGWRVERISIGTGKVRMRIWTFDMPVEFRTIPLSGYVVPRPVDLAFPRLKHCLIYFAGPGIELLAVALIGFCVGFGTLLSPSSHLAMIVLQSF